VAKPDTWSRALTLHNPDIPASEPRLAQKRRSFPALRSIIALMLREMSTRYGRTPGGYVWAVVEPVGALIVMSIMFSILLRSPSLGNSFILFYASGYLPYTIYANIAGQVQSSIQFSKPLLQYPAVSWIDAILARFTLNLLTSITVFCIVFFGILQFTTATATLSLGPIVAAVALAALLGLGIGTLNCLLAGLFSAWSNIWGIMTRPLFLIAGIFFIYEDMPSTLQDILWYTPWIHITGLARTGIFPTYNPTYITLELVLIWALVPLFLGLLLLRRFYKDILNR
jgi:capsular polysaccharide transport system permease protein